MFPSTEQPSQVAASSHKQPLQLLTACCFVHIRRLQNFSISRYVSSETSQKGGFKWLDLDTVEQRYLLTAAADTTVEAFDILVQSQPHRPHAPVAHAVFVAHVHHKLQSPGVPGRNLHRCSGCACVGTAVPRYSAAVSYLLGSAVCCFLSCRPLRQPQVATSNAACILCSPSEGVILQHIATRLPVSAGTLLTQGSSSRAQLTSRSRSGTQTCEYDVWAIASGAGLCCTCTPIC